MRTQASKMRLAARRNARYAELRKAGIHWLEARAAATSKVKFEAALAAHGRSHGNNAPE